MGNEKLKVLLTTEGTYPFHQGGVSTWCDLLVNHLDEVDYTIYSVIMDPYVTQKFKLPDHTNLIKMPLWGTEEPSEHLDSPFSHTLLAKKRTTPEHIRRQFIPLFEQLIKEIISPIKNPKQLAKLLLELNNYFQFYEYKVSFKSEEAWESFKRIVLEHVDAKEDNLKNPDVFSLIQSLGWIYRFLNIINTPIPDVDVTHSSAAAFCGIPCVLAKLKYGTPYMLTEHGVYLREQYLSLGKREYSNFLNTFLMRLVHSVTGLNFTFADQVSPVCYYNTRWEQEFGVTKERIKVIYNGVDKSVFGTATGSKEENPTVITTARIDPIKDIEMLIKTADIVRKEIPNVKFVVYGSVSVPDYYNECLELRKKLELEETVIFAGHTSNVASVYKTGDLVAVTSISEAFPYTVIEAMMAGTAVISTDVGGVKEALGNTGVLVPARNYEVMAKEITRMLRMDELRQTMAEEAKERALSLFTIEKVLANHMKSYQDLAAGIRMTDLPVNQEKDHPERIVLQAFISQRTWMERGLALKIDGHYHEALHCFRNAIQDSPSSKFAPILLLELAEIYNHLGEYDLAFHEMEKYKIITELSTA